MAILWCCLFAGLIPYFSAVSAQTFTVQPQDVTVKEGMDSDPIVCEVDENDGLAINQILSFQRDSVIITDGGNRRDDVLTGLGLTPDKFVLFLGGSNFNIYNLIVREPSRSQSADYKCVICGRTDNKCDEDDIILESDTGTLLVAYPPESSTPVCSMQPGSNGQVMLDDVVTLSCVSDSAVPAVDLTWARDGQSTDANVTDTNGNRRADIVLTAQNSHDGAVYTCQLSYTFESESLSGECSLPPLNVVSDPVVTIETSQPVNVGQEAVFTCTVSSRTSTFASDATQWDVPDTIDDSRYTVVPNGDAVVLTIASVQIGDHGASMVCRTRDQDGMVATKSSMLLIEGLPEPTEPSTRGTTTNPPSTTPPPFPLGGLIAGLVAALVIAVLIGALIAWQCRRRRLAAKSKQAGVSSHVQIPMNNMSQSEAMPNKVRNVEGKDNPDNKAINNPDVIPREKRGGPADDVDPRKWWRETVAPTESVPYERGAGHNDYPTIKGMKMPFQDRASPYMMYDEGHHSHGGYQPLSKDYNRYDDRDFSDSGYREPRYDDGGYEDQHSDDHRYESAVGMKEFQDRGSEDNMPSDYNYDNRAYDQSLNGHVDHQGRPDDAYNDQYNDQYSDQYNDHYNDRYDDRPDDQYDDQPNDRYNDQADDRYSDQFDHRPDERFDDQPDGRYDDQFDDQPDDRYNDRYESYGYPDGQEYNGPADDKDNYYPPNPNYDQDERIPDGHSSSNDHYYAPYDDPYGPPYDDQPSDPYGHSQDYSGKASYDDDLRNSQSTPSYV